MVEASEGHAEVLELCALAEDGGGQLNVADDGDVGLAHTVDKRRLILFAVHVVGEPVPHGGIVRLQFFKAGLGNAQRFYANNIHN